MRGFPLYPVRADSERVRICPKNRVELGGFLGGSALRRRCDAALARAGLRRLRFHDLRHTFGTRTIAKADIRPRAGLDGATPTSRPR